VIIALAQQTIIDGEVLEDVVGRTPAGLHPVNRKGVARADDTFGQPQNVVVIIAAGFGRLEFGDRLLPLLERLRRRR
jgi:hypothetical protein